MNRLQRTLIRGAVTILTVLVLLPPSYDASPDGSRRISQTRLRPITNLVASTDPVLVDWPEAAKELGILVLVTSVICYGVRTQKGK